jgi:hypothetical protein
MKKLITYPSNSYLLISINYSCIFVNSELISYYTVCITIKQKMRELHCAGSILLTSA